MVEVISRNLMDKGRCSMELEEALQNKVVDLYFSAIWSAPCHSFTSVLCGFYMELLEEIEPVPFEVVFILSDHSAEEVAVYMPIMHGNWLALPYHDPYKHVLKKKCNITAIPKLVIEKQKETVITDKERNWIRDKGLPCFQNWFEGANIFQNFSS
ncbi:NXNL2 protein, partial [Nothoprocta ornata]|nr:NXNL2 protein [Nothoprocta pentlandii]NWY08144.1 NXNL2 protein [Nothoprocta ornata]